MFQVISTLPRFIKIVRKSQSQSPGFMKMQNTKPRGKNYRITTRQKNLLQSEELVEEEKKR